MRRRPVDFRRPVRRRVSNVVVWSLCGIVVLLFIVIFSKESRIESRPTSSIKVKICALQDFSVVCSIAWFLMCLIAVKCGNFEGNQCFEFWDLFFFVIWDLKGQWGLIGFSLVLLFGLMKVDIYIFGDSSNIMTWLLA